MPSPSTTDLPRPKAWDEFEDICADVLKRIWDDPYIVRNGRSGQRQQGVDCYGLPKHHGATSDKRYAGAQCKKTDLITIRMIEEEVGKAKEFKPILTEYLIMTTAPRDANVQEEIRVTTWPFDRVHVLFWDDISLELSSHDDLLQKHFPGWIKRTATEDQVLNMILSSQPEDFRYDDSTGVFFHKSDISLCIVFERGEESEREFLEPWVSEFPNPRGTQQPVYIYYKQTRIMEVPCVYVDGARYVIPYPRSSIDLTLTPFRYHIGRILNDHIGGHDFDIGLEIAGIKVRK